MTTNRLLWKTFVVPGPKVSKPTFDTLVQNDDLEIMMCFTNWTFIHFSFSRGFQQSHASVHKVRYQSTEKNHNKHYYLFLLHSNI